MIADSSFYICFLDDIACPSFLNLVLSGPFQFLITPILHREIKQSRNYPKIQSGVITEMVFPYNISEILKPLFGKEETLKGEHEVIAFAHVLYQTDKYFGIILDEAGPRKFLEKNFPYITHLMRGTAGFVKECHCDHNIISKKSALEILQNIRVSKFRISSKIISLAVTQVRDC